MSAGSKPSSPKEIPLWKGALFGTVLAASILALVLRPKRAPAPRPAPSAAPVVVPIASSARPAPPLPERVVVFPVVHPAPSASVGVTAEREAIDALHNGNFARAAELYRALAAANPENAAIVETARLLNEARRGR